MAFADFTITPVGAEWLAQAVEDGAQGTHLAKLYSIDFGDGNNESINTLWKSCTTSLRVAASGNSVTLSGIVSNEGDSTTHRLNRIEVWGRLETGDYPDPELLAWSVSEQREEIPPASEQLITRRAVIQIALSGEASVTIDGAMSGYAAEDEVTLLAGSPASEAAAINHGGTVWQSVDGFGQKKSAVAGTAILDGATTGTTVFSVRSTNNRTGNFRRTEGVLGPAGLYLYGFDGTEPTTALTDAASFVSIILPPGQVPGSNRLQVRSRTNEDVSLEVTGQVGAKNIPAHLLLYKSGESFFAVLDGVRVSDTGVTSVDTLLSNLRSGALAGAGWSYGTADGLDPSVSQTATHLVHFATFAQVTGALLSPTRSASDLRTACLVVFH